MSRIDRKREEREQEKIERKEGFKNKLTDRVEEFKLNREGKTKRKRSDVMGKYRRTSRMLSIFILIVLLLFIITWVIILFY